MRINGIKIDEDVQKLLLNEKTDFFGASYEYAGEIQVKIDLDRKGRYYIHRDIETGEYYLGYYYPDAANFEYARVASLFKKSSRFKTVDELVKAVQDKLITNYEKHGYTVLDADIQAVLNRQDNESKFNEDADLKVGKSGIVVRGTNKEVRDLLQELVDKYGDINLIELIKKLH